MQVSSDVRTRRRHCIRDWSVNPSMGHHRMSPTNRFCIKCSQNANREIYDEADQPHLGIIHDRDMCCQNYERFTPPNGVKYLVGVMLLDAIICCRRADVDCRRIPNASTMEVICSRMITTSSFGETYLFQSTLYICKYHPRIHLSRETIRGPLWATKVCNPSANGFQKRV